MTNAERYEETTDAALLAALSRFEAIFENTPMVAIQGYDPDGTIRHWNQACTQLYGYARAEALGRKMQELLFSGEEIPKFEGTVRSILESGKAAPEMEWLITTRNGSHKWVFSSMVPVFEDGRIAEIFCMDVDITGLKLAEEKLLSSRADLERRVEERSSELRQKNQSLKEAKAQAEMYLDLICHDINNMNQAGIGYLEFAIEAQGLAPETRKLLECTLGSLRDSSRLISSVSMLQQIRSGEVAREAIDVSAVLSGIVPLLAGTPGRSIRIAYQPAAGNYVAANELIKDVFSNILGNSVKHSAGDLEISIGVDTLFMQNQKYCRVCIEDNGPGIDDDLKARLFVRLQRGDTRAPGKGLGLYLARTLVDAFDGMIWVEDRIPGDSNRGCRFVVMLPAAEIRPTRS